ncbi:hypothetical protein DPMN_177983 [Dreissena polymorpha]|uniref:Uncharacterized protein n=1 Tax=Dreissena polymorpha TaxID=45954 RepID=A0A9D4IJG5_DREPO|nr:hypothetical protein DPMN_177983 [Dreissena polymorpha]
MSIDFKPCQDGRRRPRQYTLQGKYLSAVVVGCTPPVLLGIPTPRTAYQGKTLSHRLMHSLIPTVTGLYTYPPENTYIWASILLAILTSGNTSAHVRGPGSKRACSSHQASASI